MTLPMTVVRIIKNWEWPDLLRQTPGCSGMWNGIQFTLDPVEECDYTVVLNRPAEDTFVKCSPPHVWAIIQEPPNEYSAQMHRGDFSFKRIYTSNTGLRGKRYVYHQPAAPWHVNRDYDWLSRCQVPGKERNLSWITSNKSKFKGHRDRLRFLENIRDNLAFDLYGSGFRYIEDKWDGLAPYRYSIVVENFSNPYYWSEKLADCFLAWTMPIYYGCTRITDFFPKNATVCIDINKDAKEVAEKIQGAILSDLWRRSLDVLHEARQRVLERYQLFPFVVDEIRKNELGEAANAQRAKLIKIPHVLRPPLTTVFGWRQFARRFVAGGGRRITRKLTKCFKG